MCGISGVYRRCGVPDRDELEAMNQCQRHRGPDSEGYFIDPPVGFAQRRLSIVGVETGDQPISNEDGSVVTIFNGEIYNYPNLRTELEASGHDFSTDTDTEVLVHLYEEHGRLFVEHLEGMFAFALWDRDEQRLLLARDPLGIKPLVFADDGDRFGFASELSALLQSRIDLGGLDWTALSEYFALGFVPAPRTAFENAQKVEPGELLTVSADGVNQHQFYEPSIEYVDSSFADASAELRRRLLSSVEDRLMSDVPLGAFLSGGIDSTILSGALSELRDDPIQTFTVGFENERFNEAAAARTVAEYHETDHTEYTVSIDDVRATIPDVLGQLGEPFADPSLIPTAIVARETSQDVKVALSGDGADELFAGYNRYRGEYYSRFYRTLPRQLRTALVRPVVNRLPATRATAWGEAVRKGQKFVAVNAEGVPDRHFEWVRKTPDSAAETYQNCNPKADGAAVLRRKHDTTAPRLPEENSDSLSRIMAVDTYYGLPNQMLRKVDTASMSHSLEVRVPFLDTSVVEYALGIRAQHKMSARGRKRVLKSAFSDFLPPEIQNRSKQGFEMPIGEWLKDELQDDFRSVVTDSDLPLLDSGAVLELHDRHISGRRDYEWFLWNIYVFAYWWRRMVDAGHLER